MQSLTHATRSKLALFAFALAFVVILLGAYTRLTNAGLSCPDWPHCYGYLTAPHTAEQLQTATERYPTTPVDIKKAWTEMTHRYFAGTEGIIILVLAGTILFKRKRRDSKAFIIIGALITLLAIQVLLGMLTVTALLKPVIVLGHLLTGLSILGVLWWAYLDLPLQPNTTHRTALSIKPWLWLGFFIIAAQIALGGWVSTHYAGLACIDFPYCNGKLIPALQWGQLNTDLITIHMLHRFGALITALYLGTLGICLLFQPRLRILAIKLLILLSLQLTLGILNIIWLRPVWLAMCHHAVAILILLIMIAMLIKASAKEPNHV